LTLGGKGNFEDLDDLDDLDGLDDLDDLEGARTLAREKFEMINM